MKTSADSVTAQPVVFEALLFLATALIAGMALVRPLAGEPGPAVHRVVWWAAWLVAAASMVLSLLGTVDVLSVVVHAAVCLGVSALLPRRYAGFAGGLLITLLLVIEAAVALADSSTVDFVAAVAFRIGVVLLLGAVTAVLTAAAPARRLAPVAIVAVVALAGTGMVQTLLPRPGDAKPGVALLREVELAGHHLPVLLTPQRPGPNLVRLGDTDSAPLRVGTDPGTLITASERPGTSGKWALIQLPEGSGDLVIERGGERTSIRFDTGQGRQALPGIAGPDGPECADMALGAAVAITAWEPRSCPADDLAATDEAGLRRLVAFLAGRGIHTLALTEDESPRSVTAAAVVRDAAARRQLTIEPEPGADSALVVVSGWEAASRTLTRLAERQYTGAHTAGTYLAPWLLAAEVIEPIAGTLIPLPFDPRDEQPVSYEIALGLRFPGTNPSTSGYRGWSAAKGIAASGDSRLYAASLVSIMPGPPAAHRHDGDGGWLPGGTVVPVTGPL